MFKPNWKPIESEQQLKDLAPGSYWLWIKTGEEVLARRTWHGWQITGLQGLQDYDAMIAFYSHYALIAESGKVEAP